MAQKLRSHASSIDLKEAPRGVRRRGGGYFAPRYRAPETDALRDSFRTERARYANLENGFRTRLHRNLRAVLDGKADLIDFTRSFSKQLYEYQTRMYITGRRSLGVFDNALSDAERQMLHGQHARQMKFFHGFMRDIASGKGRMDYQRRADMYALSGYSIYLRGAAAAYPFATNWRWIVNPEAENCVDCLAREEESKISGYSLETLERIGYPGEGQTVCRTLCRCHLEPIRGRARLNRTRPTSYNRKFPKVKTNGRTENNLET